MRKFIKRNKFILLTTVVLLGYFIVNYQSSMLKLRELENTRVALEKEIQTLEDEVAKLNDAYAYVQTEEAIEQQAREKLKMVKNNEIVYLIRETVAPAMEEQNEKSKP